MFQKYATLLKKGIGFFVVLLFPAGLFAAPSDAVSNFYSERHVLSSMGMEEQVNEAEGGRRRAFQAAMATLEFYMELGVSNDAKSGAKLCSSYRVNERRALVDTRMLYRKHSELLNDYVSISNDIYGYEFTASRLGTVLDIEGGVQTSEGTAAEFVASMVWSGTGWQIWSLEID